MRRLPRTCTLRISLEITKNLEITDSGLCINPEWPFISASPNGIISCHCHGIVIVMIPLNMQLVKMPNSVCKSMMMGLYILTMDVHTITGYKLNYLHVKLTSVTFVFVHLETKATYSSIKIWDNC